MKNVDVSEIKDFIEKFNNAQPGSVDRIKAFLEISQFEIEDKDVFAVADILMQIRYSNNEADHEIIMEGLAAVRLRAEQDDSFQLEMEERYGENPWHATNSILSKNGKLRDLLKKRSDEEHKDTWFESFMEYES